MKQYRKGRMQPDLGARLLPDPAATLLVESEPQY